MNIKEIGLNRYLVEFSLKEKDLFLNFENDLKNKDLWDIEQVFINNGYCLELKAKKVINLK